MDDTTRTLIQETKVLNLSTQSSSGTLLNGDYKSKIDYIFKEVFVRDTTISHVVFSIPYVVIPNTYYIINENNNVFAYQLNGVDKTVSFSYGNYNANNFINQFNTLVNDGFTITLDFVSSTYILTNTQPFTLYGEASTIDYVMGFNDYDISGVLSNGVYTARLPRPCNFLPMPRIMMHCPQLCALNQQGDKITDVVLSIPNNAKLNSNIIYSNEIKTLLRVEKIDKLTFYFTDENNNLLNFNGISSFWTLQIDIFRYIKPMLTSFKEIKVLANKLEPSIYAPEPEETENQE